MKEQLTVSVMFPDDNRKDIPAHRVNDPYERLVPNENRRWAYHDTIMGGWVAIRKDM